tara:strand:- start:28837 stop:29352 length:516 start_codon:yes stop_codon:yes gene_type:complete
VKDESVKSKEKKVCLICGATLRLEHRHCSAGCMLAAKIPAGKDALPASWQLSVLLVSCFVLFNQALFLVAGLIKSNRETIGAGDRFLTASLALGTAWLLFALTALVTHFPKRFWDFVVGITGIFILVVPLPELEMAFSYSFRLAIVNLLICTSLYRGVYYLWVASKKNKEK